MNILYLTLFLASNAYDVVKIEHKIAEANNINALPIVVVDNTYLNCGKLYTACTNGRVISITYNILNTVRNEDEIAAVIGHEMAHAVYRDEMQADVLGLKYAEKAGYNYCRAAQLLKLFPGDPEHPAGNIRYKNTGCP